MSKSIHRRFSAVSFLFWICFVVCFSLPFVRSSIKPLDGYFQISSFPPLKFSEIVKGSFQDQFEQAFNDHLPGRSGLIRWKNTIDFFIFNKVNAHVELGLNGNLFEPEYLEAYSGVDLTPLDTISSRAQGIKRFSRSLEENGKSLLVVMAPSKTSFFKRDIPKKYPPSKVTNASRWKEELIRNSIPFLDLSDLLKKVSDTVIYPIFPIEGIHWTEFANILALDTLLGKLRDLNSRVDVDLKVRSIEGRKVPDPSEQDLGRALNLLEIPQTDTLFGDVKFDIAYNDSTQRPGILFVGDSFIWQWYGKGYFNHAFEPTWFFYYNQEAYLFGSGMQKGSTNSLIEKVLEDVDVVVLMATEANFRDFPWGFEEIH